MNAFSLLILPMGVVFIVSSFTSQLCGMGDAAGARRYGWYGLGVAAVTQLAGVAALPAVGGLLGLLDLAPDVRGLHDRLPGASGSGRAGPRSASRRSATTTAASGNTRRPMLAQVARHGAQPGRQLAPHRRPPRPAGHGGGRRGAGLARLHLARLPRPAGRLLAGGADHGAGRAPPAARRARAACSASGSPPASTGSSSSSPSTSSSPSSWPGSAPPRWPRSWRSSRSTRSPSCPPSASPAPAPSWWGRRSAREAKDEVPALVGLTFRVCAALAGAGRAHLPVLDPALVFAPFAVDPVTGPALLATGQRMLVLSTAWLLFDAAAAVLAETLRAAGDTAFTLWARLVIAWGLFVPGAWVSVRVLGSRRPGGGRLAGRLPGGAGAGALGPLPGRRLAPAHAGGAGARAVSALGAGSRRGQSSPVAAR